MKGLEAAIRNALAKAGETDAQMRARIYQSARAALESGLKKQGIDDPAVVARQRQRLESVIEDIEREERLNQTARNIEREKRTEPSLEPPPEPVAPEFPSVEPNPATEPDNVHDYDASHIGGLAEGDPDNSSAVTVDEVLLEDRVDDRQHKAVPPEMTASPDHLPKKAARRQQKGRKQPRRRWIARLFSLVVLIGFGVTAYWWAESSGLLLSPQERDTSVPNPPPSAEAEDFEGGLQSFQPERGFNGEWAAVYEAGKSGSFTTGADAIAEQRNGDGGQFLAVSAPAGGAGSSLRIAIPRNLLSQMAGNRSIIAVTVRGISEPTQMSVTCNLGAAGSECGSHRFTLTGDREDLFFDVETPGDAGSSGDGSIIINPAAGGADGEIELFAVHIEPAAPGDGS